MYNYRVEGKPNFKFTPINITAKSNKKHKAYPEFAKQFCDYVVGAWLRTIMKLQYVFYSLSISLVYLNHLNKAYDSNRT